MRKALKISIIVLGAVFLIAQFVRPDRTVPLVDRTLTLEADPAVPEDVKAVVKRSCNDCHSHETVYPWYSHITPASWFLQGHIDEGRNELNFSLWGTYSESAKDRRLDEICENVKAREMPLPSYLWIHRDAALSDEEIGLICSWTEAVRSKMEQ